MPLSVSHASVAWEPGLPNASCLQPAVPHAMIVEHQVLDVIDALFRHIFEGLTHSYGAPTFSSASVSDAGSHLTQVQVLMMLSCSLPMLGITCGTHLLDHDSACWTLKLTKASM